MKTDSSILAELTGRARNMGKLALQRGLHIEKDGGVWHVFGGNVDIRVRDLAYLADCDLRQNVSFHNERAIEA